MNDNNIKLLPPPQEQPEQPKFPVLNVQIQPQGVMLTSIFGPSGPSFTQMTGEADMNQICEQWRASRREIKRNMDLAAEVLRTKNRN